MTKLKKFLDKEESKNIFEKGFIDCGFWEMVAYSRYAYHFHKWSRDKILKNIKERLTEKGKNTIVLRGMIYDAIKGYKYDFLEHSQVEVTVPEMEKIKLVDGRDYQKSLFGLLVLAKQKGGFYGNKLFFSGDIRDLISKSGVSFSQSQLKDFLFFAKENGFISSYIKKKNKSISLVWIITFVEEGDIYCRIDKFDKVQEYLPNWCFICKKETGRGRYCFEHKKKEKSLI